ncbi:MAG: HAD family hydrolase [Prevotella sp.]
MDRKRIYVFDFDGTLTRSDTLLAFIRYVAGTPAFLWGFLLHSPWLLLMLLRLYPNWKCKQRVFSHFFKGMEEADFDACCHGFAHSHFHLLRPAGVDFIRQVSRQGNRMVVVTASVDRWVAPFFEHVHLHKDASNDTACPEILIIGTEIEVKGGKITGKFLTPNCYGAEKVRRLRMAVPDVENCDLVAFGDSRGDREMLAMAKEAYYKPFREKSKYH